jgi:hypothetical protein
MPGLPKRFAKMGFKKGWAAFRAGGGASKRTKAKKHTRHARPKRARAAKKTRKPTGTHQEKGVTKMAKRRRKSVRGRARRAVRRVRAGMETRPGKVVTMALSAAAGGILTSLAVNNAPVIKDQSSTVKSVAQGALGIAAIMFVRNKHVKSLGAGAVIAAVMGAAKSMLKVEPLAGPSAGRRVLSPSEMNRITGGQMNIPLPGRMGVPLASAPGNAGFNRGGFGS